jgi:thiamine-phosphate pyrophosphorylase
MAQLYAIVDVPHPYGLGVREVTEAVLGDRQRGGVCGASVVQLRAKHASTAERRAFLEQMRGPCDRAGAFLVVNDDEQAVCDGVHGLHLGQGDPGFDHVAEVRARIGPGRLVGVSTHDLAQLRAATRQRPDYVAFGPVAPTRSKENPDPTVGFEGLLAACRLATVPLAAIGGLDAESGAEAARIGAHYVAVIGGLVAPTIAQTRERAEHFGGALAQAVRPLDLDAVARAIPVLPRAQLEDLARWSDSLGVHIELGLPARFRPWMDGDRAWYRPCDVLDLQYVLDKKSEESWDEWQERIGSDEPPEGLVRLRLA